MGKRSRGHELSAEGDELRDFDPDGAGAIYLQAREVLLQEGDSVSAAECTLSLAQLAADRFDLESAHRYALLAADGLASDPERQQRAYMLAGRTALASDAMESARGCFVAAANGDNAWQALEALADLEYERGDLIRADECLREAWARLPGDAPPVVVAQLRERFGHLALEMGKQTEALAAYECAIRSLAHCGAADSQLMRARLTTDVADLYASFGRTRDAMEGYRAAQAYYLAAGLNRRAERMQERIVALELPMAMGQ